MDAEVIEVVRGNDLYFPNGNERGDFYEPLWIAKRSDGKQFHGTTPEAARLAAETQP